MHKITLIPGDGIGREISEAAKLVIKATGVKINWDIADAGAECIESKGSPLPDDVLNSVRKNRVALKGPITTPIGTGFRSVNVSLRKQLNLFANLRPAKTIKGVKSRYDNVDLIVVRENTEDLYAGIERQIDISNQPQGIYFIKISGKNLNFTQKIIKIVHTNSKSYRYTYCRP
jgi:isocitrate dehydrogenase (NAD+)